MKGSRRPKAQAGRALTSALALALATCRSRSGEPAVPPLPVSVSPVTRRDLIEALEVTGTLDAIPGNDVKLGSLLTGRLTQVLVAEGDPVIEGQLLAKVEATSYADAVHQAEAALAEADATEQNSNDRLKRAERLFDVGVSARQEVDDARTAAIGSSARVKTARAGLSSARAQLARTEIKAPFAGVVARLFAAAGEPLDTSKPVIEVAKVDVLELRAGVPAREVAKVHAGQQAQISVEGLPTKVAGEVFAVSPSVDPTTGAAVVRLRLNNPGGLRLGQLARARIAFAVHTQIAAVPNAAIVPAEATTADAHGQAVVVVDPSGQTRRVPVEPGVTDGVWTELRSGPEVGQPVVVQGAYALPNGTLVSTDAGAATTP